MTLPLLILGPVYLYLLYYFIHNYRASVRRDRIQSQVDHERELDRLLAVDERDWADNQNE